MVKLRPGVNGSGGGSRLRVPVRVVIADDHVLFAKTLEAILAGDPRVEVVGTAYDGREALTLVTLLSPDIVLMDLDMPIMDGFEATRRLRVLDSPTQVLILTASEAPEDADRALREGAVGYLTKDRIAVELLPAILEVAAGRKAAPLGEAQPAS